MLNPITLYDSDGKSLVVYTVSDQPPGTAPLPGEGPRHSPWTVPPTELMLPANRNSAHAGPLASGFSAPRVPTHHPVYPAQPPFPSQRSPFFINTVYGSAPAPAPDPFEAPSLGSPLSPGDGATVVVANLPPQTTEENLMALMAPHGTVQSCLVVRRDGQPPVGHVQYRGRDMAEEAVEAVDGLSVADGRRLHARILPDRDATPPSPDLLVANIPPGWHHSDLHAAFSPYGRIMSHAIFKEPGSAHSLRRGIVRFATVAQATAALDALDQQAGPASSLRVRYAEAPALPSAFGEPPLGSPMYRFPGGGHPPSASRVPRKGSDYDFHPRLTKPLLPLSDAAQDEFGADTHP